MAALLELPVQTVRRLRAIAADAESLEAVVDRDGPHAGVLNIPDAGDSQPERNPPSLKPSRDHRLDPGQDGPASGTCPADAVRTSAFETDYTLEEVGETFGVTRERIRQIEAKALGQLGIPRATASYGPSWVADDQ